MMLSGNIQIEDWQATFYSGVLTDVQQDGFTMRVIEHFSHELNHGRPQLIVNHDSRPSTMPVNSAK